jgi:LuxR family maltose regulon positive regulatory protein
VRWQGRPQQKPLTLLKALLALGGRKVSEAEIRELLWPDTTGDLQHRSFETTLYRLRQLLGVPGALDLTEGRLTLDPRYCWVDRWAFERRMTQFETAFDGSSDQKGASSDASATVTALGREALGLYCGPFLSGEEEIWAVLRRERLRNRYLRGIEKMGRALERAGNEANGVDWYRKGLDADPLAEELCRHLMRAYHRMGRRADALAASAQHKQVLARTLGIAPSPQIEAFAREIRDRE